MPKRPAQFETLIRIRQRQEDLKAQALAATRRQIQIAQEAKANIEAQQKEALLSAAELAKDAFDASQVRYYFQYERYLARRSDEKDAEIRDLQDQAEVRRLELEEAMKQRRMVEKLQERKMDTYRHEVRRLDQKLSDEAASSFAARNDTRQRGGS
ncbi:MAG: flagellar FliJ family protein [Candidatus Hydrogenedentes bacterium]|nr:flagellar FliJ family protein [Candidatus Hydrogenedentota bacterium]